jgi:RNA polymerase sigma factor (sigma-70 family)
MYESAVQELSDDQRKVFIWQQELGLSTQEIAEILNKSKSSVGSLKHRAIEKLQAYFKEHHKS